MEVDVVIVGAGPAGRDADGRDGRREAHPEDQGPVARRAAQPRLGARVLQGGRRRGARVDDLVEPERDVELAGARGLLDASGKHSGVQGHLKLTVVVLGPGDEQRVHKGARREGRGGRAGQRDRHECGRGSQVSS